MSDPTRSAPSIDATSPDFRAELRHDAGGLIAHLAGEADTRASSQVGALLSQVHADAVRLGLREVVVDLRAVVFMSSVCIKRFVMWLVGLDVSAGPYRVRFLSNPGAYWQTRTLAALRCLAQELVFVEP